MIDFNECEINDRTYGGASGNKIGISYKGEEYFIKYPGNLKNRQLKNIVLSYSNAPICEYIGSHIYSLLDIPVHDTILGIRNGKMVVACKDFLKQGDKLSEFREIKTTIEPDYFQDADITSGSGTDLEEVLKIIDHHRIFKDVPGVKERFWDMFIVDAYIGNSDRNNGNWGLIKRYNGQKELSPVYDNGGCLNNKWDDEKMGKCLKDTKSLIAQAYGGVVCIFAKDDKRINPFHYMSKTTNKDCINAIGRIVPKMSCKQYHIEKLINNTPISDTCKKFYQTMLRMRYSSVLQPLYLKYYENTYTR